MLLKKKNNSKNKYESPQLKPPSYLYSIEVASLDILSLWYALCKGVNNLLLHLEKEPVKKKFRYTFS